MTDPEDRGIGLHDADAGWYDEDAAELAPVRPARRRRTVLGGISRFLLFLVVAAVVVGAPVGAVWYGAKHVHLSLGGHSTPDYAGSGTGTAQVHIQQGDSATAIGQRLLDAGVVKSVKAFTKAAANDPASVNIQPGYYQLHHQMSGQAALQLLEQPSSRLVTSVTIPEGTPASDVYALIAKKLSGVTVADLQQAAKDPASLGLPSWAKGHVEGFLFPATYSFDPGTTATDALKRMVATFDARVTTLGLESGSRPAGVSPYAVLTIASICEKEAKLPQDFPKVAQVVYNRIKAGMPLQFDSTLEYVLPKRKGHLLNKDLENPSPYNTYKHKGLPPTPIDNPGDVALKAALHPTSGSWLYFVTVDKAGHTAFATSYQQFLTYRAEAQRNGVIPGG